MSFDMIIHCIAVILFKNRAPARKKRVITAWPAAFEGGYSAAWTER